MGYETPYKWGYIHFVVTGAQRVSMVGGGKTQHLELLKYLITMGAPIDLRDIAGYTCLHHVSMRLSVPDILRTLLEAGADPNWQDKYGGTPIAGACMTEQPESIELLMEFGADLDIKDADDFAIGYTKYPIYGPKVASAIHKWVLKRKGEEAPLERKCDTCGKPAKGDLKLSFCSTCRMASYCSRACQS